MPTLPRIVPLCMVACMAAIGLPACSDADPQAGNDGSRIAGTEGASSGGAGTNAAGTDAARADTARAEAASAGTRAPPLTAVAEIGALAEAEDEAGIEVEGEVRFEQESDFVRIEAEIRGLDDGLYGFHIHSGRDCAERGGHYDPTGSAHGSPDEPAQRRHVGDLGNLVSRGGVARYVRIEPMVALEGADSVVGRVAVIHDGDDQFLPQPAGDSGTQIGCGVIEAGSGA